MRKNLRAMMGAVMAAGVTIATAGADVLLLSAAAGEDPWNQDVAAKIRNTGRVPGDVDVFNITNATPTLDQLLPYDAVMVFTDFGAADPDQLGNVVADYCDAGGGVVQATFSWHEGIPLGGRWRDGGYSPMTYAAQDQGIELTLGTRHLPNHPVLDDVTTFSGGDSSYHNTGTVAPNALLIADWSNGVPLLLEMPGFDGSIIGLNFYPPSSDAREDFWRSSTDGDLLLANAMAYVSGGGQCQYTVRSAKAKGGCQTCPNPGDNLETESRCEELGDCRKKVKTTISCPEGPGTCKVKGKREACE